MLLGKVVGKVVASIKYESARNFKMLLVNTDGRRNIVAVDELGADIGNQVLITTGSQARFSFAADNIPIDAVVIAIVDSIIK